MKKYINYESIIGNFLILDQKKFIYKRELEKFYNIVEQLLPKQYYTYPDITFEEFCEEYNFLIKSYGDIAIPTSDKEKLIEIFGLGLPKKITNIFKAAFDILKSERINSRDDLNEYQNDYLKFLNYLNKERSKQTIKDDMDNSVKAEISNEKDFTRGPRLIKK